MTRSNEIKIDAQNIYQKLLDDFTNHRNELIVMSHFGTFSQELVNSLSEGVEMLLKQRGVKKIMIKRVFSIMIEGLQNIRLHGELNNNQKQLGHVMISEEDESFSFSFGNIVNKESKSTLTAYLDQLNLKNYDEMKAFYLDVLGNGMMTNKGGAGLGFTTIALKSKSKIKFQFISLENEYFYFEMRGHINLE